MNRIKELRLNKGLSQYDLEKNLSFTQNMISKWENEKNQPTLPALIELADFFNCSIDYLVGRECEEGIVYIQNELSKDEEQLLDITRKLNQQNKEIIYTFAKLILEQQKQKKI